MKYNAVIWDLDGTLLNTIEDLTDAVNDAMTKNGFKQRTIEEVTMFVGNGIHKLIERCLPEGENNPAFNSTFEDFKAYYAINCNNKTKPYIGITKILQTLKDRNIKSAIVSNKNDSDVKKLSRAHFTGYISTAIGNREGFRRKPYPDSVLEAARELNCNPEKCLYIGDSDVDIATAANSGMDCLSVTWGFRTREFLIEHGAQHLASNAEEVLSFIG